MLAPTCLPLTCPEAGGSVELLSMGVSLVCRLSLKTGFCVASSGGKAWGVRGGGKPSLGECGDKCGSVLVLIECPVEYEQQTADLQNV